MISGDQVTHPDFGVGTIKRVYPEGPTALVDFGYMDTLVPSAELDVVAKVIDRQAEAPRVREGASSKPASAMPTPASPRPEPLRLPESPVSALSREVIEARRAIVALRLGQVLESRVSELSVGLGKVEQQLDAALSRAHERRPAYVMVEGAWGGGKTHVLTLLEAAASRAGFVSSSVVMDGIGVTLWEPMQLMEAITNAMRFPGDVLPGAIMHHVASAKIKGKLDRIGRYGTRILGAVFEQLPRAAFEDAEAVAIIEDYLSLGLAASNANSRLKRMGLSGISLPPLRARSLSDRAERFCDLLYDWTEVCVAAGAVGLVVILDELDVEYAMTAWGSTGSLSCRGRRAALLKALSSLRRARIPLVVAFAAAPAGVGVDANNDAVRDIANLVGNADEDIVAPIPREGELRELSKKVLQLYRAAYPAAFPRANGATVEQISDLLVAWYRTRPNPVPRYFVRSALEVMDVMAFARGSRI